MYGCSRWITLDCFCQKQVFFCTIFTPIFAGQCLYGRIWNQGRTLKIESKFLKGTGSKKEVTHSFKSFWEKVYSKPIVILNKARVVCWLTLPNKVDKPSVTCCLGVPFVLSQCKQICTEGSKGPTSSHRVEWNKSKIAFWRRVLSIFKDLQSIYQHGVFFFWTSCLSRLSSTLLHDFLHRFLLYEFCTLKYSCTREGFVNTRRIYALVVVHLFFLLSGHLVEEVGAEVDARN